MVRAGEASGDMAAVLEGLCRHFERVADAREKVLMAMIYPAIILVVGLATMLFAMMFVVPRFVTVFRDLGTSLPVPTLILMGLSNMLVRWGWLLALTTMALVWLGRRALRRPRGRRWWHGMQLRLPLVRHIVTANAYAHFARTLGVLLGNGVPVLQALEIVEHTVGNQVLADEIREARDRVTDGTTISGPLAAGKIFPPLLTDMLAVGEKTGDLSGALGHIARRYDGELDRNIKIFTSVLEPVMILIMAVVVGFIAISLLLAVFDMTSGLKM
jgi:type IV pilus assembly protein PilC